MDTYEWILKNIVDFNEGNAPKVLLTDFDPSMSGAIEKTLPNTVHLLCQWHMQQNFKKHFLYLSKSKGPGALEKRYLYRYLTGDCIFNDNVKNFWKISEVIFNSESILGSEKIKYL
jgi:hypothetical protein